MAQSDTAPAARTRAILFVVIASCTGIFSEIFYGPLQPRPDAVPVMGLLGLAGGAVLGLIVGSIVGAVSERREQYRNLRRPERW